MAGAERAPRWAVHVEWLDGALEDVVGDPNVVDGVLVVRVLGDDDRGETRFEAQYPLQHVRVWWCDYCGEDSVRADARGRRSRIRPSPTAAVDPWDVLNVGDPSPANLDCPGAECDARVPVRSSAGDYDAARCTRPSGHDGQHVATTGAGQPVLGTRHNDERERP